ncbi:hypothetical protein BTVI_95988 [Pitangus sulphuratus]|nr:hypothetical protein BTVI_95988 [Pitangus sulphuratus]
MLVQSRSDKQINPITACVLPAVESLHSLNDQISHFIVNKSKALDEDEDAFLPSEKESLKSAMMLMRHLLMDAQTDGEHEGFGCVFGFAPQSVLQVGIESYNHGMVWVGRDLKAHLLPPPDTGKDTFHQTRLLQASSNLALNTSRDLEQPDISLSRIYSSETHVK